MTSDEKKFSPGGFVKGDGKYVIAYLTRGEWVLNIKKIKEKIQNG